MEANDEKSLTQSNGVSKDMQVHCKLLYAFDVLKQGFGMSEDDIKDFFYSGRLRINKVRSGKRYAKVGLEFISKFVFIVLLSSVVMKWLHDLFVCAAYLLSLGSNSSKLELKCNTLPCKTNI